MSAAKIPPCDTSLIRLCARLVAVEAQYSETALRVDRKLEAEKRGNRQLDGLQHEEETILDQIHEMPDATSPGGLRAMAEAAMALATRISNGAPKDANTAGEWLAYEVSRIIAAGAAS